MHYLGGMLGGTWLTALPGDLGKSIFDGANLVANFESLNPANTYWTKAYNVYSKVDTEAERFLDFETWWGSPVLLNSEEMQRIADNLFVGNRQATGRYAHLTVLHRDLRNITAPVIAFLLMGRQHHVAAAGVEISIPMTMRVRFSRTASVYTMHQSIGHLGIFVSGKVATKEHGEFVSCKVTEREMQAINIAREALNDPVVIGSALPGDRAPWRCVGALLLGGLDRLDLAVWSLFRRPGTVRGTSQPLRSRGRKG